MVQQKRDLVLGREARGPITAEQLDVVPWSHGDVYATVEFTTTATVKSIELAAFMDQAGSDSVLAGRVLHTGSIVLTHAVVPSRYGRRLPMAREEGFFDELARGLADGSVTRGKALRLMSAALLGARLHP